ncbi:MAG: ShlB/FhaC/HecB family hemolysin secretion/activation protein [Rickettsiales bacterium]
MKKWYNIALLSVSMVALLAPCAFAVTPADVPSAADAGRIRPEKSLPKPSDAPRGPSVSPESVIPPVDAPEGAESVRFQLRSVAFTGVKSFDAKTAFQKDLAPLLNQEISLKDIYILAAQITRQYREAGYILSYAYVPDQNIENGNVTIAVAEGFISNVVVKGDDPNTRISQHYIARITAEQPLRDKTLESALLRLNDLPGYNYRAVLSKEAGQSREASTLTLIPQEKSARTSAGFDNYSSRYLGPNEVSASYIDSFLPLQQTTLLGLTSLPTDKLNYALVNHSVVVAPDITLEGSASYTQSKPAYTLTPLDIDSTSTSVSIGMNYQWIRQRNENLLLKIAAESRNVASDTSNTPLTRDHVRTLRSSLSYDTNDQWNGDNILNLTLTQGIDGLGSSKSGDLNLSRSQAKPDFTKAELSISRIQALTDNWAVQLQVAGQLASDPLYASEEFGVGGQQYGRAYDTSEIVGDKGASGAIELRYTGLRTMQPVNFEPFLYFDGGIVTNRDVGQSKRDSLTSVGGGVRFATQQGQAGILGLALPLAREVNAPNYGQGKSSPRILLQVSQNF